MEIRIFENHKHQSQAAAELIAGLVRDKPKALLCLPAGHTSLQTYAILAELSASGKVNFQRCRFVGLDEWLGLNGEPGCLDFLREHFFTPLRIPDRNIVFFDRQTQSAASESQRINRYLAAEGPIDLVLLGIGQNGHLGLNEPGTGFDSDAHVADLDAVTRKVCQKYFPRQVCLEKGLTLGIRQILEARCAILEVSGTVKADILHQAVDGQPTVQVPASAMQLHSNAIVLTDAQAASRLTCSNVKNTGRLAGEERA